MKTNENNFPVTIFIPFRKGSKGLPNKNISDFNGIPLFLDILRKIVKVPNTLVDKIVLATDYPLFLIGDNLPKDERITFFDRKGLPSVRDDATTEDAIEEYLTIYSETKFMLLIQITNPAINHFHINEAIKIYSGEGTMFSVVPFNRHIWNEEKKNITYESDIRKPRQEDKENYFLENGSFYLFNCEEFLNSKNRFNEPLEFYPMEIDSIFEIDSMEEKIITEALSKELIKEKK